MADKSHSKDFKVNGKWDKDSVIDYVCDNLASSSFGVKTILDTAPSDMPDRRTVMGWISKNEELDHKYARAKELQADYMAEEILAIADESTNDYMTVTRGDVDYDILNSEHVQRSRLRIESRKWLAGKLRPKKYGDKVHQEITGKDGGAISVKAITSEMDPVEAAQIYKETLKS